MSEFEHTCYLSDGTLLLHVQYTALMKTGSVTLDDGRTIKTDPHFERDYCYMQDVFGNTQELEEMKHIK